MLDFYLPLNSPIFTAMLSTKIIRLSIVSLIICCFTSCETGTTINKTYPGFAPAKMSIFNNSFIANSDEAPIFFLDIWNRNAIRILGIRRITVYCKGGKNPEDTLEKRIFDFKDQAQQLNYSDYRFDETADVWSAGSIYFDEHNGGEIKFSQHFGIKKNNVTRITPQGSSYLLLREKSGNRYDTTWVEGSFDHPKAVISKIGKSLFSMEVFVPEGSSTSEIATAFRRYAFPKEELALSEKTVVFTSNGKPLTAFALDENFSQVSQLKTWSYLKNGNLEHYEEYVGITPVRTITWTYRRTDNLPESMTIDRKQYFYAYE